MSPKDIALYFIKKKGWQVTPKLMQVSISQVKSLLGQGFTSEDIVKGIDYFIDVKPPKGGMYSLGFLNYALSDALEKLKAQEYKEQVKKMEIPKVVRGDKDNSTENNQRKLQRFNNDTGFRTKLDFDLFKKP